MPVSNVPSRMGTLLNPDSVVYQPNNEVSPSMSRSAVQCNLRLIGFTDNKIMNECTRQETVQEQRVDNELGCHTRSPLRHHVVRKLISVFENRTSSREARPVR